MSGETAETCSRCGGTGLDQILWDDQMPLWLGNPAGRETTPCRECRTEESINWIAAQLDLKPGPFPHDVTVWQIVEILAHNVAEYRAALARVAERSWIDQGGHAWASDRGPAGYCQRCGVAYSQWDGSECCGERGPA